MKSTKILNKLFYNQNGGEYFKDDVSAVLKFIFIIIIKIIILMKKIS